MDNIEYAIYGIIEPYTRKIVFIDYYVYDWDNLEEYPSIENYIDDAIALMQGDDRGNEYWRDLENMWNSRGSRMGVVVLDTCDIEQDAQYMTNFYRNLFKPRYNIKECKCEDIKF